MMTCVLGSAGDVFEGRYRVEVSHVPAGNWAPWQVGFQDLKPSNNPTRHVFHHDFCIDRAFFGAMLMSLFALLSCFQ